MKNERAFRRGLTRFFVDDLRGGLLHPLLKAALLHELDLQIRDEYISLYYQGLSVLKLMRMSRDGKYRAKVHLKYLGGMRLSGERSRDNRYVEFDATSPFIDDYAQRLAGLTANAAKHRTDERDAEQSLVRSTLNPDSPITILDRQVQVHGIRKRADIIGITRDAEPRLILGEVKAGLNNDIQHLLSQLRPYYDVLAGTNGRLKEEIACAYRNVVMQKQQLGVLPQHVAFPSGSPHVECLVILCDYCSRSQLFDRAREQAKKCGLVIWVIKPAGPDYRVPDRATWERITP